MSFDPLDMARRMAAGAETGTATTVLEKMLGRHQASWHRRIIPEYTETVIVHGLNTDPVRVDKEVGWCGECDKQGIPCDQFILGAMVLSMVELLDGTRFSDSWRGPVEDRRYSP